MIYFDNAATTIRKPDCVVQAVTEAMCSLGNAGRGVHNGALSASRILYEARVALSELFGAENPERIAFTANATEALNIAIKGVLRPGDTLVAATGKTYDTLEEVIGIRDSKGSLKEYGIR